MNLMTDLNILAEPLQVESPANNQTALLELKGFGVAFGKKIILSDVTLSIEAIGTYVLLGPSGID